MSSVAVAVEAILNLIQALMPNLGIGSSGIVDKILIALIQIVPIVAQEVQDFLVPLQNIITALKNSGPVTPEQMAQLEALNAQVDAAFDAAAKT